MLKKILIMSMLLISGLNAENSLAEEAAFKKQQEQRAIQQQELAKQKNEKEAREVIIPRIKKFNTFSNHIYEKYFVKKTDTPEIIDNKYSNRIQFYKELEEDLTTSNDEFESLVHIIDDSNWEVSKVVNSIEDVNLSALFSSDSWNEQANYLPADFSAGLSMETYIQYLKDAYASYEDRQRKAKEEQEWEQRKAKEQQELEIYYAQMNKKSEMERAQAQKQQQLNLANEKKERQRVQGACQAWRTKANKMVYSLGVGDQIIYYWTFGSISSNTTGVIRDINANTFLIVDRFGNSKYAEKSSSIAYKALKTAPSPYCYQ